MNGENANKDLSESRAEISAVEAALAQLRPRRQARFADERKDPVRQAIAQLPRRDVEILLLKYTENWSYEQLAQHTGASESAIESRLHRARRRLRKQLAACEIVGVER